MRSGVAGSMVLSEESATELARLRSEFRSLPGLCLTVEQVARLLDAPRGKARERAPPLRPESASACRRIRGGALVDPTRRGGERRIVAHSIKCFGVRVDRIHRPG